MAAEPGLEQGFDSPPDSAKPRTWWHWVSGNVSAEGITADLEAMKRVGLGGAQNFTVDQSSVIGPVKFMSPEWRKLVQHALSEAGRLRLEYSMEGCDGWSESGGPWVTKPESMQKVVWTEQQIAGGKKVALDLPKPEKVGDDYADIALLAFPTPKGAIPVPPAKITSSDPAFDGDKLRAGSGARVTMAIHDPKSPQWIQAEYPAPTVFRSAAFEVYGHGASFSPIRKSVWEVQASDDGATFRTLATLSIGGRTTFPSTTGSYFRVWVKSLNPKAESIDITSLRFGGVELEALQARTGMSVSAAANNFVDLPLSPGEGVKREAVVDLTGRAEWEAPPGNWTLLRLGHVSTGATTHPSTTPGLECDKLSAAAVTHHLQNMFGPVFEDSPKQVGTTLKYILLDSWECGCENWTPLIGEEFKKRRGYALAPWLPALAGEIVDSGEATQRFLWDYRRTLADLLAEEHYGTIRAFAHAHGMGLTSEAPGIGSPTVADALQCKGNTDIPMGEFWVDKSREGNIDDPKEAASAAHIYGRPIAATESFTSVPQTAAWTNDPASLKALGDEEFCLGINRFVFHRYAHQPWLDRKPGMSMGPWGINFERTNTWWEQGKAWLSYLSRCEYLLQRGKFAADLCYFYGEGAPAFFHHASLTPPVPAGFDYDVCNAEVLLTMKAEGGRIVLPGGMSYRVLVLPPTNRMTLPVLRKVEELVAAGGVVYGPEPVKSPSLSGYPACDDALAALAGKIWGDTVGKSVTEHVYGKGRVVWGAPLEKALGVGPDFTHAAGDLLWIHRHDRPVEIYFISNQEKAALTAQCAFLVTGLTPELWHPDTGARETLASYKEEDGMTKVTLHFDPTGSVFVIFRKPASSATQVASVQCDGKDAAEQPVVEAGRIKMTTTHPGQYVVETGDGKQLKAEVAPLPQPLGLEGPWKLSFPPKLEAPPAATFDHLISWPNSDDPGIKYFSGTATYTKEFDLPKDFVGEGKRVCLNLGEVKNLAEVSLNGRSLGILWKAPFKVDVTDAAKAGVNCLEIKITNLWPNRLIGDMNTPEAQRVTWTSVQLYKTDSPLLPSGLLGPVTISAAKEITF